MAGGLSESGKGGFVLSKQVITKKTLVTKIFKKVDLHVSRVFPFILRIFFASPKSVYMEGKEC